MRMKRVIAGLNNTQKVRVIVDGVGFVTDIYGVTEMPFTSQRASVWQVLEQMVAKGTKGMATRITYYDNAMKAGTHEIQVDLL